jgi:hypothetical protein
MADTLLSVAQDELTKANDEMTKATSDLTGAQGDLAQAQGDLATATASLAGLQDARAALLRQIAQTTIAADGQQLFDDLDANTTKIRSRQAAIVDAQERIAYATSRITAAQDELEQATAAAAASKAAAAVAQKRDDDHTAWIQAATSPPLQNIPGQASVTNAGAAKDAADAAIARLDGGSGGDIPHELFQRAQERRAQREARAAAIAASAAAAEDDQATASAQGGLAGTAAHSKLAFMRSETAVRDFALTAQERYDRALALLAGVANSTPLNAAEQNRIATLLTEANNANAFALQKARDSAQSTLDAANDAVDAAVLAAIANDPSGDPSADANVQNAVNALPALQQALSNAKTAFVGAPKDALDALEASVPDATWSLFDEYQHALSLLAGLNAVDPTTITGTLTSTEQTYADALRGVQDNARAVLALGEVAKERDARAESIGQTQQSRLLQALRGDE